MSRDPFALDTGFPTDYDGTVREAWFEIPEDERRGKNLMINWKMELDDPGAFPSVDGGLYVESWGCGEGWETPDGGDTAVYPGNDEKRYHQNSGYGKVIARAAEFEIIDELRKRGAGPNEAKIWVGLRFHIAGEEYSFKDAEGKRVTGTKNYPVAFLGVEGDGGHRAAASGVGYSGADLGASDEEMNALRELAASSPTFKAFMDGSMKLDFVGENDKVILAIAEESFYKYLQDAEVF